jgi:hypothetical protein
MPFSDRGFDSDRLALLQRVYDALCAAHSDLPREDVASAVLAAGSDEEAYDAVLEQAKISLGVQAAASQTTPRVNL